MGDCWTRLLSSGSSDSHPNSNTTGNYQPGSSQFFTDLSNTTTTSNDNTSTSLRGSQNSQTTGLRNEEEFPCRQILDAVNLRVFTLAELRAATKNFRADNVLGEGGFGIVYKGLIKDRTAANRGEESTIAIKRLNSDSLQGVKEWQAEVEFLWRLSHPNLIKLLGFGREDSELFLVYELMQRGSLDNQLFGRGANVRPLSWDTRLKVMIGAARALDFLRSSEKKIIYRDVKTLNILLDKTYSAKLSDFGLAKYGPSVDQTHLTTRVMGTHGYAAPEYISTGHLYVKSDVYGLGVVLLEMLTGKRIRKIMRLCQQKSLLDWLKSNPLNRRKMRSTMGEKMTVLP